jgi:hypothetical protein
MAHFCPHCQGPTKLLSVLSDISVVDYYVCEVCDLVLERPKGSIGTLQPLAIQTEPLASPTAPRGDSASRTPTIF